MDGFGCSSLSSGRWQNLRHVCGIWFGLDVENGNSAHEVRIAASVNFFECENATPFLLEGLHSFLRIDHVLGVDFVFDLLRDMLVKGLEKIAHDGFLGHISFISVGNRDDNGADVTVNEIRELEGLRVSRDDESFQGLVNLGGGPGLENVREESQMERTDNFDGGGEPLLVPLAFWFALETGDDVLVEQGDVNREVIIKFLHENRKLVLLVGGRGVIFGNVFAEVSLAFRFRGSMVNAFKISRRSHGRTHGFDFEAKTGVNVHLQDLNGAHVHFLSTMPGVFWDIEAVLVLAGLRGVTKEVFCFVKGLSANGSGPVLDIIGVEFVDVLHKRGIAIKTSTVYFRFA